jgi:hypothetical protein
MEKRTVQVHGAAYAAFMAAQEMFGSRLEPTGLSKFVVFVAHKCHISATQIEETVNVNQFWSDAISAFRIGVFGDTVTEQRRFFKVKCESVDHPPGADTIENGQYVQGRWKSYLLFIEPKGMLDLMRKHFRQQGKVMPLELADLREQMSRRPYFSPKKATQRFGSSAPMNCWMIEVDNFPELGYRRISDEEYLASRRNGDNPELPDQNWPEHREWADPRKGDLFTIIEAVEKKLAEASDA